MRVVSLSKKLAAAVVIGFGVVFASKARHQHWSETPTALIDEERAAGESSDE